MRPLKSVLSTRLRLIGDGPRCYLSSQSNSSSKKFLPLEIRGLTNFALKDYEQQTKMEKPLNMYERFPNVLNWTNIWPAAATFHHSVIPFNVRQGHCKNLVENKGIPPGKYANVELMKIPNFLHLTVPHIKKHCDSLRKYCTVWPSGLDSDEKIEKYYPLEVVSHSYVFTSTNIRDPRSRMVTLQIRLSSLSLDEHAKRKLLRLATGPGPGRNTASYDWNTDILKLTTGRCPTSKQNTEFLMYLLSVLTLESKKTEKWEVDNPEYDWLQFDWNRSESRRRLFNLLSVSDNEQGYGNRKTTEEKPVSELESHPSVVQYREALQTIWAKNDILNGDQWIKRSDPPKCRHGRLRPIRNVPFTTVPGADDQESLKKYASATRNLFGLNDGVERSNLSTNAQ
ncbi:unnamed protein product [Heterobilharzia americana]|nr:unnamed protein product [Heterobilharzia americana]